MSTIIADIDSLLRDTDGVRAAFDEWSQASRSSMDALESNHRAALAAAKSELSSKSSLVSEIGEARI